MSCFRACLLLTEGYLPFDGVQLPHRVRIHVPLLHVLHDVVKTIHFLHDELFVLSDIPDELACAAFEPVLLIDGVVTHLDAFDDGDEFVVLAFELLLRSHATL